MTRFISSESGSVMPFPVLVFAGAIAVMAYSFDTTRTVDSISQVKRATDAAAMAVGYKELANSNSDSTSDLVAVAREYISNNLGMDSLLADQVDLSTVQIKTGTTNDGATTYQVSVDVKVEAVQLGQELDAKTIYSTVEVMARPTEITLMLPNTNEESDSDIAALKRLGKAFAEDFIGDSNSSSNSDQERWLSLVPYSDMVNVYDEDDEERMTEWASSDGLNPTELHSLFRTGKLNSLADDRAPDVIANRVCLYRGLYPEENYYWDQAPTGQFDVYYLSEEPDGSTSNYISWFGPNPNEYGATVSATRYLIENHNCPEAPVLPLTNNLDDIDDRLDDMTISYNTNYAISLGWAAMTLSPEMRGSSGWGDSELPLDFSNDDSNYKAIIMLANTSGNYFDTDSANFYKDDQSDYVGTKTEAKRRMVNLCNSIHERNIHVFLVGVRPGDPDEFGVNLFDTTLGTGLKICTEGQDNMHFVNASGFAEGEEDVESALDDIAEDIRRNYYVHLIN